METIDTGVPAEFANRFAATLANWKRKLLDLSRRNRALNFKPTKVSTIAIIDERPAEVFRHIYIDEMSMRFKASQALSGDAAKDRSELETDSDVEALEFDSESEAGLEY